VLSRYPGREVSISIESLGVTPASSRTPNFFCSEKSSVTENYVDTLPEPIKEAVKAKKAIEGMNRDQVILAVGRPVRKTRESKEGTDYEDWIYGEPPGRVTFVTFTGDKVVKVKETYAGLGGSVAETPQQP